MFKLFSRKPKVVPKPEVPIETINDLLTQDDISAVLNDVNENKTELESIVIVYKTKDGFVNYNSSGMEITELLGLMEFAKNMALSDDE